jgi:hypothetical protein
MSGLSLLVVVSILLVSQIEAWAFKTKITMSSTTRALPKLPLPEPILSMTPGTWAHDTMSRRVDSEISAANVGRKQSRVRVRGFQGGLDAFQRFASAASVCSGYETDVLGRLRQKERRRSVNVNTQSGNNCCNHLSPRATPGSAPLGS